MPANYLVYQTNLLHRELKARDSSSPTAEGLKTILHYAERLFKYQTPAFFPPLLIVSKQKFRKEQTVTRFRIFNNIKISLKGGLVCSTKNVRSNQKKTV